MEFSLLNWNLQFAGSRKHNFFYDGGDAVDVPINDLEQSYIDRIEKADDYSDIVYIAHGTISNKHKDYFH